MQLNEKLIINQNNRREYQTSFQIIINELVDRGVLRRIRDLNLLVNPDFISEDNTILALNSESNYGYFRLPVEIRGEQNGQSFSRNLELVLRTDNLYVEGLMVNNNYYHFDFSNIDNRRQPAAVRDGSVPHLTRIDRTNNINLSNIRPDYIDLLPDELSHRIYWTDIYQAFLEISNIGSMSLYDNIRYSLGRVIVITAESLRFWSLHTHIIQQLVNNNDGYIVLQRNIENPIYNTLVNWNEESRIQSLIIYLLSTGNDRRPNPSSNQESINILTEFGYLRRRDNESFINLLARILILPINQLTNILGHSNIRIILSYFIKPNLNNCNRRKARQITNNNYWHEKFCDLKPQIDKIQGKITTIKVLDENNKGKLTSGEVYVGTTNGFYLIHSNGDVQKFNNIDEEVTSIKVFDKDKFYIITKRNEIYFLRTDRIASDGHLFGEILSNIKSSDLNKELKIYYENNKKNIQHIFNPDPAGNNYWSTEFKILNLGKINPVDNYKKIEFLGDIDNDCWGTLVEWINSLASIVYTNDCGASWGEYKKWKLNGPSKSIKTFLKERNNKFDDIIENTKNNISPNKEQILQKFTDEVQNEKSISINQRFGLTFYWENENYYLKVFTLQYCEWWGSNYQFNYRTKIGNGIKLYNDEWNDNFSKYINNEQNLPIINNTNFVKSNITSL